MLEMAKVNVYANEQQEEIIGRVEYNNLLDVWDGSNNVSPCGGVGQHLGITKLRKEIEGKSFVLIHGTIWEGKRGYGRLVSDSEAQQAILLSGEDDLLKKYFPDYRDLEKVEH